MDKRTFLFIILSVFIWFGYIHFIAPRFASKEKPAPITKEIAPQSDKQDVNKPGLIPTESVGTNQSKQGDEQKIPTKYQQPSDIILKPKKLENNYFQATISNKGAGIESFTFKQYKATKTTSRLSIINAVEPDKYALTLKFIQSNIDIKNNLWEIVEETDSMIKFRYTTPEGLVIYKAFSLNKYNYTLDYNISLENISDSPITSTLVINGTGDIPYETYNFGDITGLHAYTDKENKWYIKEQPLPAKLKSKNIKSDVLTQGQDNVVWTGIASKYFATILVPVSNTDIATYNFDLIESSITDSASAQAVQLLNLNFYLQTKELFLKPGEIKRLDFIFYAGPKATSELATFTNSGFDKLLSYGWFGFISKILLFILAGLYGMFKNYGIAIIVLTIIIKVVLFPITKKGQVSMYRLQKLAPRIKALQAQYKNDKQRLGVEQLKLWKEYGVNPLSGCLPIFLQIPVFFGLYWALALAIELRQAPFMLWINDLSQADHLCKLPFPILGATYLHVLPLIMTLSWLIQSLTQPKSPDPQTRQQQKLFIFMPLIFGIMFYNVPSGLTLYWFTSTLLGIVEQLLIKKYYFR
ncbi:MAG: membrane protein insertase YidC [Planctomycetota bacterium]